MSTLRAWLARRPHPSTVKFENAEGEERTLRIGVARSKFRDAENALAKAISCEAFNEAGDLIRVWEAENIDEQRAASGARAETSVEGAMLIEFARLLQTGCDQSVQRYEAIVGRAFDQQGVLVATLSGRLAALEKAWHELLMAQEPEDKDENTPLVQSLLAAALTAPAQAPPAAPNGKK